MYDIATAAVEAALAAGASYADARDGVPDRGDGGPQRRRRVARPRGARRGRRPGLHRLQLGFHSVPDLGPAAPAEPASRRRPSPAPPRAWPVRTSRLAPEQPVRGSWESECLEDPWSVGLAEKGDHLEGVTRTLLENGADVAEAVHRSGTPASGSSRARARAWTSTSSSAAR